MDAIGNPSNQFSGSYDVLKQFRHTYAQTKNEYSGSRTLFNELITLYKFYFNRSVFEAIKNLVPARANALVGIIIEPTVLERPKYHSKPVFSEANTGSAFYASITASHYFRDPNTKLLRMSHSIEYGEFNFNTSSVTNFDTSSMPINRNIDVDVSYINLPSCTYPINFLPQGTYYYDVADQFQLGHYGSSELIAAPSTIVFGPVSASFAASPLFGLQPLSVTFFNQSANATTYNWNFGDGTGSTATNPTHVYNRTGSFTVMLSATGSGGTATSSVVNYIQVTSSTSPVTCTPLSRSYTVSSTASVSDYVELGGGTGYVKLKWSARSIADRFRVTWNGTQVIDSGYVDDSGSLYFNKSTSIPTTASVIVSTAGGISNGSFEIQCPVASVACVSLSGSYNITASNYVQTASLQLGSNTGIVQLRYVNEEHRITRFKISWNGSNVIDTGYVNGSGSYIFNKSLASPVDATLYIYSPGANTRGSVSVSCPS